MKHAEKYLCPLCDKQQPAEHFSCASGAKGGRATGSRKARTKAQASKAGKAGAASRWANHKKKGKK